MIKVINKLITKVITQRITCAVIKTLIIQILKILIITIMKKLVTYKILWTWQKLRNGEMQYCICKSTMNGHPKNG